MGTFELGVIAALDAGELIRPLDLRWMRTQAAMNHEKRLAEAGPHLVEDAAALPPFEFHLFLSCHLPQAATASSFQFFLQSVAHESMFAC